MLYIDGLVYSRIVNDSAAVYFNVSPQSCVHELGKQCIGELLQSRFTSHQSCMITILTVLTTPINQNKYNDHNTENNGRLNVIR